MCSVRISSLDDPISVWQTEVKSKKTSCTFYDYAEEKVLEAQKNLSTLVFVSQLKQSVYKPIYVTSCVIKRISEISYSVFSQIKKITEAIKGEMPLLGGGVSLLKVISLPSSAVNLVYNCYHTIYGRSSEKIDAALGVLDELASLIGDTTTFCMGLQALGAITTNVSKWMGPLSLAASLFSCISILSHIRKYEKMQRLGQKLDKTVNLTNKIGEASLEEYRAFLRIFESKVEKKSGILKDYFRFKDKAIAERLVDIELIAQEMLSSSDEETQQKARISLYETMAILRRRIDHTRNSSVLAGIAATIGIIGSIAFFACPIMPVGLSISGIGAIFGGSNFIYQRVIDYQVMNQIGLKRKWYEWITC